ncbi:hypothetical protein D1007_10343 [Hordeum vulgare]|nr:hypothetical protein D1007_10343 [Hordeum vulgare]
MAQGGAGDLGPPLNQLTAKASADSTAQTGREGADDYWQEETYKMVKVLKNQYFAEIGELYNKISLKLQDVDNIIPPQMPSDKYDRIKSFKIMLDHILQMLQISKTAIQPSMRDRLSPSLIHKGRHCIHKYSNSLSHLMVKLSILAFRSSNSLPNICCSNIAATMLCS